MNKLLLLRGTLLSVSIMLIANIQGQNTFRSEVVLVTEGGGILNSIGKTTQWLYDRIKRVLDVKMFGNQQLEISAADLNADIVFFDSILVHSEWLFPYLNQLNNSIRLAYSVWEGTKLPEHWPNIFNTYFDAVVVADDYLVKVYQDNGVTIPIFMLPHGSYLEEWPVFSGKQLIDQKSKDKEVFVFKASGGFYNDYPRKNHDILVKAFIEAFGDNPHVGLQIHSKVAWSVKEDVEAFIHNFGFKRLEDSVTKWKRDNILFIYEDLSEEEYRSFIASGDCCVSISSGEGFSIVPREALAAGIPAIVTDNTAQSTICKSGLVRSVACSIPISAVSYYRNCGIRYLPTVLSVKDALLDVYHDHTTHVSRVQNAKLWLEQYTDLALIPRYQMLFRPTKLVFGDKNIVTDTYLMTASLNLYNKYISVLGER